MSLEATAGKNPVSHVGKIYNVAAMRIAAAIQEALEPVESATVQLLSAIGAPIDQPQLASIELASSGALTESLRSAAREIADEHLARIGEVTDLVLAGKARLY